ncbi:uncharacterized protein LOC112493385 [Ziziphus jujuba]|uniref:Uncharacterized protein LOC112493385 n=2 Tax=Ziziphus jujuba TaxID=326968 RepID=A0A6P6GLV2_ZIZJJ|nr:uncharacterized protein LOC112493385 [Ziziphus jujuba]KAH7514683.1 hypothetical protein FEM48_Zijuj11G0115900 [Ziziphus jujuba var. spinosa]
MEERETKKNKKKMKMNTNTLKMGRWRVWLCFKETFLVPTKCLLLKVTTPCSRHKAKGNRTGLLSLYKDMESCGEYADIRVMWEMIHSCPQGYPNREMSKRSSCWRFCFRAT